MKRHPSHRIACQPGALPSQPFSITLPTTVESFSNKLRHQASIQQAGRMVYLGVPELRKPSEMQYRSLSERSQPGCPLQKTSTTSVESASTTQSKSTQKLTVSNVFWRLGPAGFSLLLLGAGRIALNGCI